jgi:xylulose-5-phosphate/fructose-6-phosphate phosphoketolase
MRRFAIARRVRSYRRPNHGSFHVCAYDVTSAFDMALLNNLDRYQVALDGIKRIPKFTTQIVRATEQYRASTKRRRQYVSAPGEDMPAIRDWQEPAMSRLLDQLRVSHL